MLKAITETTEILNNLLAAHEDKLLHFDFCIQRPHPHIFMNRPIQNISFEILLFKKLNSLQKFILKWLVSNDKSLQTKPNHKMHAKITPNGCFFATSKQ